MTQLVDFPAYAGIEDQLDAMGQKYRVQRIIRGAILWTAAAIGSTWVAILAAHFVGAASGGRSGWTWIIDFIWAAILLGAAIVWMIFPLLIRPKPAQVARLLETRVPGLHNGPSNSLLLAAAEDLRESPFLGQIFQEIHATMISRPMGEAVKLSDLSPILFRAAGISILLMIISFCFPATFAHGWEQMFHPAMFVPQTGAMRILDVMPGDVTLVAGEPLEIVARAQGPGEAPTAKLIFENSIPSAKISPNVTDDGLRYSYRLEHVDQTVRYRLEVGGTQSRWFTATVVRQILLKQMALKIMPPPYTHKQMSVMVLTPEQIEGTAVTVPQGSTVSLAASVDVAANGAMLQSGDAAPAAMTANIGSTTFTASMTINADTPAAVLLTDGAGQIIAKLPGDQWIIHCAKDVAPAVQMKWPTHDLVIAPTEPVTIAATLGDDYGLVSSRVLMGVGTDGLMSPVGTSAAYADGTVTTELTKVLELSPDMRKQGNSIRVQVEATDNRDLPDGLGAQTTTSPVFQIRFEDPAATAREETDQDNQLAAILMDMLKTQKSLADQTIAYHAPDGQLMAKINVGQSKLRDLMQSTAATFAFAESEKIVQKTLLVLALNPAKDAVDLSVEGKPIQELENRQRTVISTLESLLAMLNASAQPATQPAGKRGDQLLSKSDEFKNLDEAMKQFMKEQQRILDQTAGLAKKPVDNFDDKDKKLLDELTQQQDKMDAFLKAKISDFSTLGEQDMSNSSLLKDLMSVSTEVTMAKDALQQKATEIAVPAEENGLEGAQEISTNIEKWLANTPDRTKWTQEELPDKSDTPMAELPKELEDMVGQLMEQEEDLLDEAEDMNANITDSIDKGVGWDAADGPIADMSAKGVTGNVLPNNNEMGGRSGEGRSGQSQGEFVGDTAVGKGGRNTPTRLDPTAFQQGQINDTSKDPVGGATGGGKLSGQGAAGLEGPVPPALQEGLKRLATKQAEIRNAAERLNLQYMLGRYDNFKLADSIALMRMTESDLNANRYQAALRERNVLLQDMDTSHLLLSGRIHVQQDTTPTQSLKSQEEMNDAMKGELPSAWSDALKEYYKKLSAE